MAGKTITDVLGSDLSKFEKDPVTGKTRTPQEIIQAAVDAGLKEISPENRGSNTSDAFLTEAIINQIAANAKRNAGNRQIAADVYNTLKGGSRGAVSSFLDPTKWQYGKEQIGKIVNTGLNNISGLVLDPNKTSLTKDELNQWLGGQGFGSSTSLKDPSKFNFIDPVTGTSVDVNPDTGEILWNRPSFGATSDANSGYGSGYGSGGIQYDANGNPISGSNISNTYGPGSQGYTERKSAYDLLYQQFKEYGLESLVEGIKDLIQKDVSPSQFTIELRNSPAYLKRFAANAARVKAGYKALDEGTYLALEDSYQNLMRNYGLPASYWEKGELGVQPGFEKLIAGNVDPVELEQRLVQAVDQIEKGPKEYMDAIKQFYPEISRSDLLSYVLDPENALKTIQSKVKAAQIGGEYLRAGLGTDVTRASELATQGVTADIARASIPTIMETAKRGGELAGFYGNAGLGLYDQATAEEEIYNLGKAAEAKKKREKLVGLEQASFAGQYGGAQGALDRGRSGAY